MEFTGTWSKPPPTRILKGNTMSAKHQRHGKKHSRRSSSLRGLFIENGKFTVLYWAAVAAALVGGYYLLKPAPAVAAPAPAVAAPALPDNSDAQWDAAVARAGGSTLVFQ